MKGGLAVLTVVAVVAGVMAFGEDLERLLTDAERERRHPSAANFGRVLGDTARLLKDGIGLAEV